MLSTVTEHYKNDGYVIVRDLLSTDVLCHVFHEMDIIVVQQLNRLGHAVKATHQLDEIHQHMRMLYAADLTIYLQSLKLWAKLFSLQALVMHEAIVTITQCLGIALPVFQTTPVIHIMANDLKITGGYHGVGVHQDWPALQSGLDTVTVWFPFMDVDRNNFPVELIPGSHKQGLFPGVISEHIYEVDQSTYRNEDFVPMEVNMGDVLFMSNFTLHRSGLQGDSRLRIACSSRYENASEKTFIERAYPSAQKRVIQRELFQPNFPDKALLEGIFSI